CRRFGLIGQERLERRVERLALDQGSTRRGHAQEQRHRDASSGCDEVVDRRRWIWREGGRGERRPEASSAISRPQAPYPEIRYRDEPVERAPSDAQLGWIHLDLEVAEGQREAAPPRDDLRAVLGLERERQRTVVQVSGQPKSGVEAARAAPGPFRKEKRIGVD